MTSRGLTAGSFGIFKVKRGDQGVVVVWNRLSVLLQAFDVSRNGVFGHFLGFGERSAVGYTSRERRHDGGETAFGLRAQNEMKMGPRFLHWKLILTKGTGAVKRKYLGRAGNASGPLPLELKSSRRRARVIQVTVEGEQVSVFREELGHGFGLRADETSCQ